MSRPKDSGRYVEEDRNIWCPLIAEERLDNPRRSVNEAIARVVDRHLHEIGGTGTRESKIRRLPGRYEKEGRKKIPEEVWLSLVRARRAEQTAAQKLQSSMRVTLDVKEISAPPPCPNPECRTTEPPAVKGDVWEPVAVRVRPADRAGRSLGDWRMLSGERRVKAGKRICPKCGWPREQ